MFRFHLASCDYWRWGSGGRQENINAICILGLNHINDKVLSSNINIKLIICLPQVFLLLWWWCLFISLVAFLRLVWRAAQTRFQHIIVFSCESNSSIYCNLLIQLKPKYLSKPFKPFFRSCRPLSGLVIIIFIIILLLFRSAWLRFSMINMRMNRYFKRSNKMDKIKAFIYECKLGDW